jgi:hypothetical protein
MGPMLPDKESKLVPAWEAEPLFERLQNCRAMLAIHGYLPDRQNYAVRHKIDLEADRRDKTAAGGPAGEG